MNNWCESCARKGDCYAPNIRPKCYMPTTNTEIICQKEEDNENGKKVWPPEDPMNVYEAMAKRFGHIENELRSMRAELAEIIRDAVVQPNTYVYKPTAPTIYWPNNGIPEACRSCTNHPSNGGTGICHCILGSPSITSGVVWTKDSIENQPSSYSTTTSTDCPWR